MVDTAAPVLAIVGIVRQGILMEEGFPVVCLNGLIVLVDGISPPGQEFVDLFIDVADIGVQIFPIGVHFGTAGHFCREGLMAAGKTFFGICAEGQGHCQGG